MSINAQTLNGRAWRKFPPSPISVSHPETPITYFSDITMHPMLGNHPYFATSILCKTKIQNTVF
ncbi:MAG: hypothetical protein COB77_07055 [Gammaproteobacteria bacterium]|nr:MAG: hypothetical protein COB77_07055 [Gammaproteobacteria bacterium]